MAEKFFWADAIADRIIEEKGNKKEYVCASGITPSGQVHIGNFREVMTTWMVVKALRDKGKKVKFIYSWDDFDRFRKIPKGVDKSYEKYLGMPISDIPSPHDSKVSYSSYFEKQFEASLKKVDIEATFLYQNEMNKKSAYADLIKVALEKRSEIMEILNKFRKEPLESGWMPIIVYCEKCKKDSTKIIDTEGYNVSYECSCGHKDTFDLRKKGIVSIKWRVDWPLRWRYEHVDFEPGGIDHSVYGGSYTTAKEISKKIFDFEPPIYQFYDWISIKGGKEFSSSEGNALTLGEVEEIYEPEVLRFLFVSMKPRSAFQISFDNDVIKLYEDFDRLEKKYFEGNANPKEKRVYEFSMIKVPKKAPDRVGFRHLTTLVQLKNLKGLDKLALNRAEKVKNWIEKYAGEDMKFEINEKITGKFSKKDKESLIALRDALKSKKFSDDKDILNEFYDICKKLEIENTKFFEIVYMALIGKKKGPRLAGLIRTIGQKEVVKILDTVE